MNSLAGWWAVGSGDPLLDATIVHAWLAHIHPFDDGNGRVARLLANLALAQGGYPPLIVSAATDRGEYYDSLAQSDEGNVLPLLTLFERVMRRTVTEMAKPGYVEGVIRSRLLATPDDRQRLWQYLAETFQTELTTALGAYGMTLLVQGYPSAVSLRNLAARSVAGNSWFAKVAQDGRPQWLLWFGFNSTDVEEEYGFTGYPSFFLSVRDTSTGARHPYRPLRDEDWGPWSEIVIVPGRPKPALLRQDENWSEGPIPKIARQAAQRLAASTRLDFD